MKLNSMFRLVEFRGRAESGFAKSSIGAEWVHLGLASTKLSSGKNEYFSKNSKSSEIRGGTHTFSSAEHKEMCERLLAVDLQIWALFVALYILLILTKWNKRMSIYSTCVASES